MRDIAAALQSRRGSIERQQSMEGRFQVVTGSLLVPTIGEAFADVSFPVRFIHIPAVLFGYALDTNASVLQGSYPKPFAVMGTWTYDERMGGMSRLYKGGRVLITYDGYANQPLWVHWTVIGIALRNPVTSDMTAESVI